MSLKQLSRHLKKGIFLMSIFLSISAFAQSQKTVTGTVNAEGAPLPGASVMVKNTKIGTATDFDGKFTLSVPSNATTLVVSFMGYQSQEVAITGQPLVIDLLPEANMMDEVVITALGIKREEKALGYAVQKVDTEELTKVKGTDLGTSLTGKVAGLLVLNSSEFGSQSDIKLRGDKTLLVIDGVPYANMSLRDISPEDVENVTILKGATASALYGQLGDNGAIMVTTKKGNNKNGFSLAVNSSSMFTAGYLAIPELQSDFGRVVNTATNTYVGSADGSWGLPLDGRMVNQWNPTTKSFELMPFLPIGKDNFKNFLEQGYIANHNISLSQQGELGSVRASITYVQNKGTYPNSMLNKFNYTMGGEMKVNKLSVSTSMSYNRNTSPNLGFSGYTGYDPMYSMLIWSAPDYNVLDYKDYWMVPNEKQNSSYTAGNNNPYFDRYERTNAMNKNIFNGTIALNYDFKNWLSASFRSGFDTYNDERTIKVSMGSFQGAGNGKVLANGTEVWGESQKGSYNFGIGRGYSVNSDLILSAKKELNDFFIDAFIGGSIAYQSNEGVESFTKGGLTIPGYYSLKASINPIVTNTLVSKKQVNSAYGKFGLSYKGIIFGEGTLRKDWSSTLAEETRAYVYPSVSGSFIASKLLNNVEWLNFWKLRSSWALSKKMADIYSINSVYTITTNAWGTLSSATFPTTYKGQIISPESYSTFEVGTAANMFNNRFGLDVSLYSKKGFDFIKSAGVSPSSGYTNNFVNIDEERTRRGIDIATNFTPVKNDNFTWDVNLNWSKYATYYTKIDSLYTTNVTKPWVGVGKRVDAYVYRDYLRDPDGNIIYSNGLPQYSGFDTKAGNSDPDWIWGANTSLTYKNWSLGLSVDGRVGGLSQTITEMYMWRAGSHPESVVPARFLDANNPGTKNYIGDGVKVVSGTVTYDAVGNIVTDTRVFAPNDIAVTYKSYIEAYHKGTAWGGSPSPVDLYSTTFFKIREMSIAYKLPASLSEKIKSSNVTLSLIGQNLFFWAKDFKYSDPDGGSENFNDPSIRYVGFDLKANF